MFSVRNNVLIVSPDAAKQLKSLVRANNALTGFGVAVLLSPVIMLIAGLVHVSAETLAVIIGIVSCACVVLGATHCDRELYMKKARQRLNDVVGFEIVSDELLSLNNSGSIDDEKLKELVIDELARQEELRCQATAILISLSKEF